jgi:DNA modification methylase
MSKRITLHKIVTGEAQKMNWIKDQSVHLVVTSPPYPMIEMWDDIFSGQNSGIEKAVKNNQGQLAFELIHQELDLVWAEIERVLIPGGFVCINVGDATRTMGNEFSLFPNHSKIISSFLKLGFSNLPNIIWRKQTNAPNKFMGSGMLPAGAYVTLEHEWILLFRKGGKRLFRTDAEKQIRKESAFFWEERNIWFSDLWDVKGVRQEINYPGTRKRSGAFPFEIPYRLVNMYSVKGDVVLDPFLGTGTTSLAAMASERSSLGMEIDKSMIEEFSGRTGKTGIEQINKWIQRRIVQHENFVEGRTKNQAKNEIRHFNSFLNMPVMTSQETGIQFSLIEKIDQASDHCFLSSYISPQSDPSERIPEQKTVILKDL